MSYKKTKMNSADTGTAPGDFTTKRTPGTQWGAELVERTRYRRDDNGEIIGMLLPPPKMGALLKAQKVKA